VLVSWPFVIWISFQNDLSCPPVLGLGSFSLFLFSSFDFEHYCIGFFFFCSKFLDLLDFSQALFRHLWWLRIFIYAPPVLLGHFQSSRFFLCLSHLPPIWGVILAKVISKNFSRLKRGLQMIYFSLVNGLSKMIFPHVKHIHFGSVSLTFMRVCNVISLYSFK
jgi:hypothetical protein